MASNELDRDFTASNVNEKWVTDVTFVPTDEGWLYLASMIDLYNREVIGWAMGESNDTALTLSALDMALELNNPPGGLIHQFRQRKQLHCGRIPSSTLRSWNQNKHESQRELLG